MFQVQIMSSTLHGYGNAGRAASQSWCGMGGQADGFEGSQFQIPKNSPPFFFHSFTPGLLRVYQSVICKVCENPFNLHNINLSFVDLRFANIVIKSVIRYYHVSFSLRFYLIVFYLLACHLYNYFILYF